MEMDMEKLEEQIYEQTYVSTTLGMDFGAYLEFKAHVIDGMLRYGGQFWKALGTALAIAELKDSIKIMRYWFNDCEKYAMMQKMYLAKIQAVNVSN